MDKSIRVCSDRLWDPRIKEISQRGLKLENQFEIPYAHMQVYASAY